MSKPAAKPVPEGMQVLSPHIVCADAKAAMDFYAKAFGAEETARLTGPNDMLMHGAMTIAGGTIMLTDENPQWNALGPTTLKGTPVTLHLYVADADAFAQRAIEAGCKVLMPVSDMFWGDRYGVLEDPFGHRWAVATHVKDMTEEEVKAAVAAIDFTQGCGAQETNAAQ